MRTRDAAVAGVFYPADVTTLRAMVEGMLADAASLAETRSMAHDGAAPKALIVPHAGYIYSGAVAATAFALLSKSAAQPRRVVLVGPAHRVYFRGLALPDVDEFDTPLGRVGLEAVSVEGLCVTQHELAHRAEHSLEVELPFLISALGSFRLVPLLAGDATLSDVAAVLDALWGGPETLVVVSSDLSHYLTYEAGKQLDQQTAQAILACAPDAIDSHQACGAICIRALLTVARLHRLRPQMLDLRSSGDTAGSRYDKVVGYGSFAFYE